MPRESSAPKPSPGRGSARVLRRPAREGQERGPDSQNDAGPNRFDFGDRNKLAPAPREFELTHRR